MEGEEGPSRSQLEVEAAPSGSNGRRRNSQLEENLLFIMSYLASKNNIFTERKMCLLFNDGTDAAEAECSNGW